jgi:hypothetical protein
MPLLSKQQPPSAAAAGQPVRLKLAGRARFSGQLQPTAEAAAQSAASEGEDEKGEDSSANVGML